MKSQPIQIQVLHSIRDCPASDWNLCAEPGLLEGQRPRNPFVMHAFLDALESSGSAVAKAGWVPMHLLAMEKDGTVLGAMPLYIKGHSMGEYVFDNAWAEAFERAGGQYYPKLQASVPFTPVTGRRFLVRQDIERSQEEVVFGLLAGARKIAEQAGISSVHVAFCNEEEWKLGDRAGLLRRESRQLRWNNRGYETFDEFLAALSSRRRKQIRRERALANSAGLAIEIVEGESVRAEHWDALWEFYRDTGARKWGMPYLTRAFFERIHDGMRREAVLFLARDGRRWVAGALSFLGRDTLFGRYWGRARDVPFLHFELCYYRAIEYAIENGLRGVEAGAGGGHKSARGYEPVPTYSLHWIANPMLRDAVARHLKLERKAVQAESAWLSGHGAFRRDMPIDSRMRSSRQ